MGKVLSFKAVEEKTEQFYSHFCGVDLSEVTSGLHFVCTEKRDMALKGMGCKYPLFILVKKDMCVVCHSPKYQAFAEELSECGVQEIVAAADRKFKLKKMRLMIFCGETVTQYGNAKILKEEDYPLYEAFFRAMNPKAKPDGWLQEYFVKKAAKGYFAGYLSDGRLLCVCDAPDMPYMEDLVQHTGIGTLEEARRKGYAKCTAALATHHLMEIGICPQWECRLENAASFQLAKAIGYKEYGMAYILEEA